MRTLWPRSACWLLGVFPLAAAFAAGSVEAADEGPNIVLILVDDMGYADAGCYGSTDIRTPGINRLAREGVRLTDAYSNAPVCTPTRTALMTGRYQQRTGLEWAMGFTAEQERRVGDRWVPEPDSRALGLPTSETSMARMLKDAGYETAAFGKWHLGSRPEYSPNAHGFDDYFGVLLGHADYYTKRYKDGFYQLYENEKPVQKDGYMTDLINERTVAFIDRAHEKPFFLYVPYNAVHFPYQPPDRPDLLMDPHDMYKGTRADYVAMLERVDRGVGAMLDALDRRGLADRTLVIFTSDNGGERLSDNTPLFHHKTTLWEGGIRVPCLLRWPGHLPAGSVSAQAAITMDLTATALAAAGVEPPSGRELEGIDLVPILSGEEPGRDRTFCWRVSRSDRKMKAIRHGRWKYVEDAMVGMLFDLGMDAGERTDLGYRRPGVMADLKRRLAEWEADVDRSDLTLRVH